MGPQLQYHRLFLQISHLLAATVIFLVSFKGTSTSRQRYLLESLSGTSYHDALLVGVGASITILLLLLEDLNSKIDAFSMLSRWVLLLGIHIPDSICLSFVRSGGHNGFNHFDQFAGLYMSSAIFKLAISIGCVCTIICSKSNCRVMKTRLPWSPVYQGYLLIIMSLVYQVTATYGYVNSASASSGSSIFAANVILCLMLFQVVMLGGMCFHTWCRSTNDEDGEESVDNGDDFVVCVCLALLFFRMASSVWILIVCSSVTEGYLKMSSHHIGADILVQIAFVVGVLVLPWPHVRAKILNLMESTLRENTAFMAYIAHEVRSPLNVAHLSLTFMRNEAMALKAAVDDEEMATIVDAIEDVDDACKSATSILDDVLLFDKMKVGKLELSWSMLSPLQLFQDVHRRFGMLALQTRLNFTFDCVDEETGWAAEHIIRIDPIRFGQVVRNLLTNAFKFTPAGGSVKIILKKIEGQPSAVVTSRVGLSRSFRIAPGGASAPQPFLRVEMVDSGAGISQENQQKLFGRYVQFNPNKLQGGGGSGLGLWISKGIITAHEGRLWAESEGEGLGSTFILEIPLIHKDALLERDPAAMDAPVGGPVVVEEPATSHGHSVYSAIRVVEEPAAAPHGLSAHSGIRVAESVGDGIRVNDLEAHLRLHGSDIHSIDPGSNEVFGEEISAIKDGTGQNVSKQGSNNSQNRSKQGSISSNGLKRVASFLSQFSAQPAELEAADMFATVVGHNDMRDILGRTCFSVVAEEERSLVIKQRHSDENSHEHSFSSLRILIVDDSEATRKMTGRVLSTRGHKIAFAEDGEEFLEIMAGFSTFDVVLMDRCMPRLDGPSATKRIREKGYKGLILGVTDQMEYDLVQEFKALGANDVLAKPLNIQSFDALVYKFLSARKKESAVGGAVKQEVAEAKADGIRGLLDAQHQQQQQAKSAKSMCTEQRGLRVLVVDDSKATRKVMGRVLAQEGHQVSFACDGLEFLDVIRGATGLPQGDFSAFVTFDVVLIDRHMPKLDGPEATRRIREEGYTGLILGLTGDTTEEDMKLFRDHGADKVLPKPFDVKHFNDIMHSHIASREY